jgi:hypothetical protein
MFVTAVIVLVVLSVPVGWPLWRFLAQHVGAARRRWRRRRLDRDPDAVLAAAFLHDLAAEWGWRNLFNLLRPMRTDHPVLLVTCPPDAGRTNPARTFLAEYAALRRPPMLLITDRPNGTPAFISVAGQPERGPWRVAGPVPDRTSTARRLRTLYRCCIVPRRCRVAMAAVLVVFGASSVASAQPRDKCSRVTEEGGQRIGVQYCGDPFSGAGPDADAERQIYAANLGAQRKAPDRTVTIVLISTLTTDPDSSRPRGEIQSTLAERRGLAGARSAQQRINNAPGDHIMIRLAVANAGAGARHIDTAVNKVGELLSDDPRALAAVVTVNSTDKSKRALKKLDQRSLLMASPTMSSDGFGTAIDGFLQLTALNSDEVQLVAAYAGQHAKGRPIDLITPDGASGDEYTGELRAFGEAKGMRVLPWKPDGSLDDPDICRHVVYFADRYTRFIDFVHQLHDYCDRFRQWPLLIADASVSRFIADTTLTSLLPHGTRVVVTVRGDLLSCAGLAELPRKTDPIVARRKDFIADIGRCDDSTGDITGGWGVIEYDVIRLLNDAVGQTSSTSRGLLSSAGDAGRSAVRKKLMTTDPATNNKYPGVTGWLQWGPDHVGRRSLTLHCLTDLAEPLPSNDSNRPVATISNGKPTVSSHGADACV